MPVSTRRFVYGLLSALGFAMMIPFLVSMRRLRVELFSDPDLLDSAMSGGELALAGQTLLFLIGIGLASGFLYAALSVGQRRAWRPEENGTPRCSRCDGELNFGVRRCPTCDQRLAW